MSADDAADLQRRDLRATLARVQILHEGAFIFDAQEIAVDQRSPVPEGGPIPLVATLADRLYAAAYTRMAHIPTAVVYVEDNELQQRFLDELVRSNASRWSWTPDFQVVESRGGSVRLDAGERQLLAPLDQVDGPDEDGRGRLRGEKGSATLQPSWYWAYGEDNIPATRPQLVRVYWNLSPEIAVVAIRLLTRALNEQRIPFQLKVLQDLQRYQRADSGVLYLPTYAWRRAAPVVAVVHAELAPYMRDDTPLFTRRLGRGLSLAEDPHEIGMSYGTHRSRLVAQSLWEAFEAGVIGASEVAAFVEGRLLARGYPLARIHLNPKTEADLPYPERLVTLARGGSA